MKKLLLVGLVTVLVLAMMPLSLPMAAVAAGTEILRPSGDGTYQQLGCSVADHYTCVDDDAADGFGTYVYRNFSIFRTDTYILDDNVGGSGAINSVTVNIVCNNDSLVGTAYVKPSIYTHGALYHGPQSAAVYASWTTYSNTWVTNPNTGVAWTWLEVDTLEAGVSLLSNQGTTYCTQVYVEVSYTGGGMSSTIDTEVEVIGDVGNPPIVKCKWETPDDGDPLHETPGTQVNPTGVCDTDKEVQFWAIVTDPEGVGTVRDVWADVWHPCGPPEHGSFKYQLQMQWLEKTDPNIQAFVDAYNNGLVTFNPDYDFQVPDQFATPFDEVMHELEQCLADIYMGTQLLSYHQPWGYYRVQAYAFDTNNNRSANLENRFDYVPVPACVFDFDSVNYGSVEVCTNKWIGGDKNMDTPEYPTVRNCGNTHARVTVEQDDMGLGMTGDLYNVEYDARVNADGTEVIYAPYEEVTLPDVIPLCGQPQKLDFSIHIKKGDSGIYTGNLDIGFVFAPFDE